MVRDRRWLKATELTDQIPLNDFASELLVSFAGVAALGGRTPAPIGLCPVPLAFAAFGGGVDLWAS